MKKRIFAALLSAAVAVSAFAFPASASQSGDVLLYYNFKDIGTDGVISDLSGNGYDAQLPASATDNGDGTVTLNGTEGIDFPAEVFAGTKDLTMSFYINQPDYRQTTNLLSYGPDKDHLMTVLLGHDNVPGPRLAICNGSEANGQEKFYCAQQIAQGEWTLVTFVINDGQLTRYIDGVEYPSADNQGVEKDGAITITPGDIYDTAVENGNGDGVLAKLGGPTAWNDPYYTGSIGAFKIINSAMTQEEVTAEYESFAAGGDGLVNVAVSGISLDKTSVSLDVGKTAALKATLTPAGSTASIIWASSDKNVATVSDAGVVTAVKAGTAIITATVASNPSIAASCTVTVKAPSSNGNSGTPATIKNGTKVVNGKTVLYKNSKAVTGTKIVTVSGKTYAVVKGYVKTGKGNRLVNIGKKTYIVNKSGIVQKGAKNKLVKVGKKSYIVNKQGVVQKNKKSIKVGKKVYKTNKKGVATKKK